MGGIKITVSDQKDVIKVLERQGYTNIKITDAQFIAGAPYHGTKACFSAQYFIAEATDSVGKKVEIKTYSSFPFKDIIKIKTK